MYGQGIKASELITKLQEQIKKHGDCVVWAGGGDYPEGVEGVIHDAKGDSYHPKNCFKIC